jgi:GNAT superfamily N-acetyltransferase
VTRVVVRRVVPDEWQMVRRLRLAALEDAPYAFLTTLAEARAHPEQLWRDRIVDNPHFLAFLDDEPVGMTVVIPADEGRHMVGVWVAPRARGRGVIDALIDAALAWSREQGDTELGLWVVEGNDRAERAYARCGFQRTGDTQPVPGRPDEVELEMTYAHPLDPREPERITVPCSSALNRGVCGTVEGHSARSGGNCGLRWASR